MSNNVKVAILDTGVYKSHEYFKDTKITGISFDCIHNYVFRTDNYTDSHGSGTACASILKNEFEDIDIFAVKVLNDKRQFNLDIIEESIKLILESDIQVVLLNLNATNDFESKKLYDLCKELYLRGKIVIAPYDIRGRDEYPAKFCNVIGVVGIDLENENCYWYSKDNDIQCVVSYKPGLACNINNSYRLTEHDNMYAAAKFTGKVAKILYDDPSISFENLNKYLELNADKSTWNKNDVDKTKKHPDFKVELYDEEDEFLQEVTSIIKEFLDIEKSDDFIFECGLFNDYIGLNRENCYYLLRRLEAYFEINFDYMNINRQELLSIYSVTELVQNHLIS